MQPSAGVEAWGYALAEQEIDKDATDRIVVTCRRVGAGSIVAVHGPLFANYFLGHYPLLRRFIGDLIARLAIPWQVTVTAPPRLELIVRQKAGRLLVNLVNRGAGEALAPNRVIVEDLPPVEDVIVRVRRARAMRAYLACSSTPTPLRPHWAAATSVLPVPRNGSRTQAPARVKKRMKSTTNVSGNFAGCSSSRSTVWSPAKNSRHSVRVFLTIKEEAASGTVSVNQTKRKTAVTLVRPFGQIKRAFCASSACLGVKQASRFRALR